MPTSMLASGFELAWMRFDEACAKPDTEAALHAVFEAVAWAGALRDRFRREGRKVYPELDALCYVRNLALHLGADALDWAVEVPGAELGTLVLDESRLDSQTAWRAAWRSVARLPKSARNQRAGEAEYEQHLLGREIGDTLKAVTEQLRADVIIHRDHQKHRGR